MIFKLHIPKAPLSQFVENIVYYSGYNPLHSKERLLPDGSIEMVIDLDESAKHVYDNEDYNKKTAYRKGWISGIKKEFITIESGQNSSMMVVRFRDGRALPFFDFPMIEMSHKVIEMEDIWHGQFDSIRNEIIAAHAPEERIAVLEKHLLQIGRNRFEINPCIDYAVNHLKNSSNGATIRSLSDKIGYSHKHFVHLFEKHVGISPKIFSRICKFQCALQMLEKNQPVNWVQVAHDCGYYDQAHFINEFKRFSGINPSAYFNHRGEHFNYLPVY